MSVANHNIQTELSPAKPGPRGPSLPDHLGKSDSSRSGRGPATVVSLTGSGQEARKSKPGEKRNRPNSSSKAEGQHKTEHGPGQTESTSGAPGAEELTEEEKRELKKLKKRDREVRRHEQAHVQAGGQYVEGGPKYEYEVGPDGKRYAVSGEVQLDTSEAEDPKDTIEKMRTVKKAALAPAEPSQQDQKVASEAEEKIKEARKELQERKMKKARDSAHTRHGRAAKNLDNIAGEGNQTSENRTGRADQIRPPAAAPGSVTGASTDTRTGLQNLRVDGLTA